MNNDPSAQPGEIILIPPTHEQSTPSFHVAGSLADQFLTYLQIEGIKAWEPPVELDKKGPDQCRIVEIEIEAETPVDFLQGLIDDFQERRRHRAAD